MQRLLTRFRQALPAPRSRGHSLHSPATASILGSAMAHGYGRIGGVDVDVDVDPIQRSTRTMGWAAGGLVVV